MGLTVKADVIENRLYFKLSGEFAQEERDKLYTEVTFLVVDLKPKDEILDFFEPLDGPTVKNNSNYLVTNGLGEIVRVIDGKSLLSDQANQMPMASSGIIPVYAKSHKEAKEQLENSIKRNGIRFYVNNIPVKYSTDKICGTGNLVNISTGGCSVDSITCPLPDGEEIVIQIAIDQKDFENEFTVNSRVISGDDGKSFAAKFIALNSDQKEQLWKCIIRGSLEKI